MVWIPAQMNGAGNEVTDNVKEAANLMGQEGSSFQYFALTSARNITMKAITESEWTT
jgi:hypothetical protein